VNEKNFYEGNQIHNFISSSGSDFLTCYGSGSTTLRSCPAHGRGAWPAAGWSSGGRWDGAARPPSAPPPLPLAHCSLRMRDPLFRNDNLCTCGLNTARTRLMPIPTLCTESLDVPYFVKNSAGGSILRVVENRWHFHPRPGQCGGQKSLGLLEKPLEIADYHVFCLHNKNNLPHK
jgi:hypothetical protein